MVRSETSSETPTPSRIESLESQVAALTARAETAEAALTNLRRAYTKALEELQLMKRRLFVAKAERSDGLADQLAFDLLSQKVETLAKQLDAAIGVDDTDSDDDDERKKKRKPSGRRDLSESQLQVVRVEVLNDELEATCDCIGFEARVRAGRAAPCRDRHRGL